MIMIVSWSHVHSTNMLILSFAVMIHRYMQFFSNRCYLDSQGTNAQHQWLPCCISFGYKCTYLYEIDPGLLLLRCEFYSTPSKQHKPTVFTFDWPLPLECGTVLWNMLVNLLYMGAHVTLTQNCKIIILILVEVLYISAPASWLRFKFLANQMMSFSLLQSRILFKNVWHH